MNPKLVQESIETLRAAADDLEAGNALIGSVVLYRTLTPFVEQSISLEIRGSRVDCTFKWIRDAKA